MEEKYDIEQLKAECRLSAQELENSLKDVLEDGFSSIYIIKNYANCLETSNTCIRNLIQSHKDNLQLEFQ
jgi:hypothetical protein